MLDRLLSDWPLKLMAVVIAFAVWAVVTGDKRTIQNFSVPLQVRLPDSMALASSVPTEVTVRLEGPVTLIRRLDPLALGMQLDLRNRPPGESQLQLTEGFLTGVPRGISATLFDPPVVSVRFEPRVVRTLRLRADLIGKPAQGYELYSSVVIPDNVTVEGPQSEIDTMEEIPTDPIPLSGRSATFTEEVGAVPGKPHVRLTSPRRYQVRVYVDVAAGEREFRGVPVVFDRPQPGLTLDPAEMRVVLSGPPGLLATLDPTHIVGLVTAGAGGAGSGRRRIDVVPDVIDLPEDQLARLSITRFAPERVIVEPSPEQPQP